VFGAVGDGRQFDPGRDPAAVTAWFTGRRTAAAECGDCFTSQP
jgi:hypothetical protein